MRVSRTVLPLGIALAAGCAPAEAPPAPIDLGDLGARADASSYQLVADGVGFRFANPARGTGAHVDGDALVVAHAGRDSFTVRTLAVDGVRSPGVADAGACVPDGRVDLWGACLRRLDVAREGVTEWWQNGPEGFEHGFTVDVVQGPRLVIEVGFEGAAVAVDAEGVTLTPAMGEPWRYDHLVATDASGRELDAGFEGMDGGVALVIDVADAELPITVDPVLTPHTTLLEGATDGERFGGTVAGAGDVSGDGIPDLIVGFPSWSGGPLTNAGGFAIFNGKGVPGMVDATPSFTQFGTVAAQQLGISVSTAGDLDGDGRTDVVVGGQGLVRILRGTITGSLSPLSDIPIGSGSNVVTVAGAGDVDGDGLSDIVVGEQELTSPLTKQGAVYIIRGLNPTLATLIDKGVVNAQLGASVAGLGDINDDGLDDFAAGAPGTSTNLGAVRVYKGVTAGLPTFVTTLTGLGGRFGASVAGAGDFNGDGYADLAVGAPNQSGTSPNAGAVYVYPGNASANGSIGGVPMMKFEPTVTGASFGTGLDGGGDLNGDGLSDLLVGAPHYGITDEGAVYALFGTRGATPMFSSTPLVTGGRALAGLGHAVALVGDLDGDGLTDAALGVPGWDLLGPARGRVQLHRGQAAGTGRIGERSTNTVGAGRGSVAIVGDFDGDGYDEVVVGLPGCDDGGTDVGCLRGYRGGVNGLEVSPSWTLSGTQVGGRLGASVTSGDFDGDGRLDLAVGAPGWDGGSTDEGAVFVWRNDGWPLPPTPSLQLEINFAQSAFGGSVAAAGDVDRDGFDDLLVGAPGCDIGGPNRGRVHLFRGGEAGLGAAPAYFFAGTQDEAQLGANVDAAGDVNGDGYADVVFNAPLWNGSTPDVGRVEVVLGSPTGLRLDSKWSTEGEAEGVRLGGGWDVTTNTSDGDGIVGRVDVERDGYADLFLGAWRSSGGAVNGGMVRRWRGSVNGPEFVSVLGQHTGSTPEGRNGFALAAGDLNGDGYGDLVATNPGTGLATYDQFNGPVGFPGGSWGYGSPNGPNGEFGAAVDVGDYNHDGCADIVISEASLNRVHLYAGCVADYGPNPTPGPRIAAHQEGPGALPALSPGLRVPANGFDAGFLATRTHLGRQVVAIEVEVQPLGSAFGSPAQYTAVGADTLRFGTTALTSARPLVDDTSYHWRARVLYDPTRASTDVSSRWYYGGYSGDASGTHVVTKCPPGDLDNDSIPDCIDQDHDNDGDLDRTDCDDVNPTISTLAVEVCDAIDQDCDGDVNEAFPDFDGDASIDCVDLDDDGDGDPDVSDCADFDAAIHHGATELCDLVDQNCSGDVVDAFVDTDGDGTPDCTDDDDDGDLDLDGADCDPLDETIFHGAAELCDEVDQDCDGDLVDGFENTDGDAKPDCVDDDDDGDLDLDESDCKPLDALISHTAVELCDAIDQNCDGNAAEGFPDVDGDHVADCVDDDDDNDDDPDVTDCADDDPAIHAGADEQCDLIDSDCDGLLDEGCDTAVLDTDTADTEDTDTSDLETAAEWVTGGGCHCGSGSALSLLWTAPLALLARRRRRAC